MRDRARTVVVGAGIVGASAAYHLAEFDEPDVLVLEARAVDPVSLVRFENVLLTKAAVAQFEEILG